ncbi:MAG: YkvA family protein [Hyphomicrobium sp.]
MTDSIGNPTRWQRFVSWAKSIKRDAVALMLAARDPRVAWPVKLLAALIAAYALSPIDLIPDFIPVIGYLDELILLPFAILLAVRLIPSDLMVEFRASAARIAERPVSRLGAALIIAVWAVSATILADWLYFRTMF